MSNRIYEAFDTLYAEDELKKKTAGFLAQKLYSRRKWTPYLLKYAIPAISCLLTVLGFTGYSVYSTPVAAVSIDVNPSVEFGINRFDRVVTVECYNDDAVKVTESLKLKNLRYDNAITRLLENIKKYQYLENDAPVIISVVSEDTEKSIRMQQRIDSCTGHGKTKVHCEVGKSEDMRHAHQAGLSVGKYEAFLELQELNPSVNAEDVKDLSMRQIQDQIDECKGEGHNDNGEHDNGSNEEQHGENDRRKHGGGNNEGQGEKHHGEGQGNGNGRKRGRTGP